MLVSSMDPALGGGCATITCQLGEKLTIVDARTDYNLSKTEEQLTIIADTARRYKPSTFIIETDAQQKGLANDDRLATLAAIHGFRVQPHLTRMQKMDVQFGVASMDTSFRKGLIRIPYGDDRTRQQMEPLLKQLREWRPDIPTRKLRQDLVMALWFVHKYWQQYLERIQADDIERQYRPSWVSKDPRFLARAT